MMRTVVVVVGFGIVCGGGIAAVRAAEGDPPCLEERERLCGMVPDTGAFIEGCLDRHRDELSADCRKHLSTTSGGDQKVRDACESDADRFCNGARPTGGQQVSCLVKHKDDLSQRCRDAIDEQSAKLVQ